MSLPQRSCANHPDRRAIGVCVITQKAICAECSTRYEGVNYSKEGLAILQEQRAAQVARRATGGQLAAAVWVLAVPLALWAVWVFWVRGTTMLMRWLS